jgi:superfamily II DNA or RNA helicase
MSDVEVARVDRRLWIDHTPSREARARRYFSIKLYDEKKCDKCEYRPERHSAVCEECPVDAYEGEYKLWDKKERDGELKIGLPIGKPSLIKKVVGDQKLKIKERRAEPAMRHALKFTGKLWDPQRKPVRRMLKKKRGILQAPPRAGKTVMGTAIMCKLGLKTMILAKQYDWLKQFHETICGVKNKDGSWKEEPQTNINEVQERLGRKIIGFCRTVEDVLKYDICLCTYQTFITKGGKKKLKKIRDLFGLVIIDECDNVPADNYLRVVSNLSPRYMVGLTATPERKDMRHLLAEIVLGTVKAVAKVETMVPRVEFVETGVSTSYNYRMWTSAINYLTKHKERNKLIVKHACRDIKAGRSIVIPVERNAHVKELVATINRKLGKVLVGGFDGKMSKDQRDRNRDMAKKGKLKGIVGIRKMVQRGINVPRWDTLYVAFPISNPPNFQQETSRIRTMMDGKPQPIIKIESGINTNPTIDTLIRFSVVFDCPIDSFLK